MKENNNPNRTCILTGEEKAQEDLLRFTLTPDRQVIPDFNKKLPGKGFYLSNSKKVLSEAIAKKCVSQVRKTHGGYTQFAGDSGKYLEK